MHHVRRSGAAFLAVVLLACVAVPAHAADGGMFSIGSGFALSFVIPDEGDNITIFNAPQSASLIATGPGLRLAGITASRGIEVGFDTSVWWASSSGSSSHMVLAGVDFEKHFLKHGSATSPFIGVDGGFSSANFFSEGTQGYLGAALGIRHIVGHENGSVKLALRARQFFKTSDLESYAVVDLGMAFDLWIPK